MMQRALVGIICGLLLLIGLSFLAKRSAEEAQARQALEFHDECPVARRLHAAVNTMYGPSELDLCIAAGKQPWDYR